MELRKSFGFGHEDRSPKAEEMSYGCASCPQPGTNLPDNWKEDLDQYVVYLNAIENFVKLSPEMCSPGFSVWMGTSLRIT